MQRCMLALVCLAGASAWIEDPFEEVKHTSCGNCAFEYKHANGYTYKRCNTGTRNDAYPYAADQDLTRVPRAELLRQGISTAQAMSIETMKTTMGAEYKSMFCASYLDKFRDGFVHTEKEYKTGGHTGAACVRDPSKDMITQMDKEARELYYKFATKNGYPSGYALDRNEAYNHQTLRYGTDFSGNIPANWCSVHMKYMLCGTIFPQVIANETLIADEKKRNLETYGLNDELKKYTGVWLARGALRPASYDACTDMFEACSRREPIEDVETKGDYMDPAFYNAEEKRVHTRAMYVENSTDPKFEVDDFEHSLQVNHFCRLWSRGHGAASAGTPFLDVTEEDLVITYSAAGASTASLLAVAAAAMAAMVL